MDIFLPWSARSHRSASSKTARFSSSIGGCKVASRLAPELNPLSKGLPPPLPSPPFDPVLVDDEAEDVRELDEAEDGVMVDVAEASEVRSVVDDDFAELVLPSTEAVPDPVRRVDVAVDEVASEVKVEDDSVSVAIVVAPLPAEPAAAVVVVVVAAALLSPQR